MWYMDVPPFSSHLKWLENEEKQKSCCARMHKCHERKDAQERPLFAFRVEKGHGWTFSTSY